MGLWWYKNFPLHVFYRKLWFCCMNNTQSEIAELAPITTWSLTHHSWFTQVCLDLGRTCTTSRLTSDCSACLGASAGQHWCWEPHSYSVKCFFNTEGSSGKFITLMLGGFFFFCELRNCFSISTRIMWKSLTRWERVISFYTNYTIFMGCLSQWFHYK